MKYREFLHVRSVVFCMVLSWMALSSVEGSVVPASDRPTLSEGEIEFLLDTAGFRAAEGKTYEEIYFQLRCSQLTFVEGHDQYEATFSVNAEITNEDGAKVAERNGKKSVPVSSIEIQDLEVSLVMDILDFTLLPGEYHLRVLVKDLNSDREGLCERPLHVPAFNRTNLVISDIQFGTEVQKGNSGDKFVKNTYKVTPNLIRAFSAQDPSLRCYFEVYNFAVDESIPNDSFYLEYTVLDTSGQAVKDYQTRKSRKPGTTCAKTERLDLGGLPDGAYALRVQVRDNLSKQRAEAVRRFQILEPVTPVQPPLTPEEQEWMLAYREIRYIAAERELRLYNSLDEEGKRRFLRKFWKDRDPTPETPVNELVIEHFRRVQYANNNFSGRAKERGIDTEKGRVYAKYGPPDDIEYSRLASEEKSYEIWTYEKQGYYEFIFRDRRGTGIYELVHSTMPGEIYNPHWRDEL